MLNVQKINTNKETLNTGRERKLKREMENTDRELFLLALHSDRFNANQCIDFLAPKGVSNYTFKRSSQNTLYRG